MINTNNSKIGNPFPFRVFCQKVIPLAFDESLSYLELLYSLLHYLKEIVIPAVNNNADAVTELQNLYNELKTYVDNYFENLDIQEEINNKLDEMAESGQLTDIIAQYLELAGILAFNTVEELENADNVVNGSICYTLGKIIYNDGFGSYYKIRNILNTDIIDDDNIVRLNNFNNLIAEKIPNYYINKMITFENNENDEIETNYKFKNVDFSFDYAYNSIISIIKLKSISQLKMVATGGIDESPESNIKSPFDYAQNNNYDLVINAGMFNTSNYKPLGHCVFNGVGYDGTGTPIWYNGFDENNNLLSVNPIYISSAQDLINYGFKNCCSSFKPVIYNGSVIDVSQETDPAYNSKQPRQLLLQDNNDNIYIMTIIGRQPYSQSMTYSEIATYLQDKNIKHCLVLDGGGSTQTVYNKKAFFESQDIRYNNGRPVPTAFVFNINDNLEV